MPPYAGESNAGCAIDVGVALQELQHEAVVDAPLLVQPVQDRVVPERRPTLVHHLRLRLRVEVLRELAHDADELALPRFELRRMLLDEVQDVLLRIGRKALGAGGRLAPGDVGKRAPQVVELPLAVRFTGRQPGRFGLERARARPPIAVDAVQHERMACVQNVFHGGRTMPLFAFHDVAPREDQVVEDGVGRRPLQKQVVAFEKRVVAVGRMRYHQCLRRHRVLLHQVRDAGVRVDDDLVGETLHAAAICLLVADELLSIGPVGISDRQPAGGVGIEHLLGRDDLDLVRIGVEPEFGRDARYGGVVLLEQVEVPVGAARNDPAHWMSLRAARCGAIRTLGRPGGLMPSPPCGTAPGRPDRPGRAATRASSRDCA